MIKNLHRADCLLLHGWKIIVTDSFLKEISNRCVKTIPDWPLGVVPNYVWRSPRDMSYGSHSILHVPDEAWNDANENGDFQ